MVGNSTDVGVVRPAGRRCQKGSRSLAEKEVGMLNSECRIRAANAYILLRFDVHVLFPFTPDMFHKSRQKHCFSFINRTAVRH
jgi:hypothetical protein